MAPVQREPTAAAKRQIQKLFEKISEGEPVFVDKKKVKNWYGIVNTRATEAFLKAWKEYCDGANVKLLKGDWSNPSGYLIVRKDSVLKKDDKGWLEPFR
jgi:hypothetical protein